MLLWLTRRGAGGEPSMVAILDSPHEKSCRNVPAAKRVVDELGELSRRLEIGRSTDFAIRADESNRPYELIEAGDACMLVFLKT